MAVKTHNTTGAPPSELMKHDVSSNSLSITLTTSLEQFVNRDVANCDACLFCDDTCGNADCTCTRKASRPASPLSAQSFPFISVPKCGDKCSERTYTMCQLRRHNTEESAWLLVGDTIYDATRFLEIHPGGKQSILKKSGGACDCTADMHFHSRTAIKKMKAHKVGKVRKCEREAVIHATDDQCIIC